MEDFHYHFLYNKTLQAREEQKLLFLYMQLFRLQHRMLIDRLAGATSWG